VGEEPSGRWPFPIFAVGWLALVSVVMMLKNGAVGILPLDFQYAVGFTPSEFFAHPWVVLRTPVALLFNNDAVQFSYVAAIFMLAVPAFEVRHGWRRTVFVFVVGGLGSVFAVTIFVLGPLYLLFPGNAVVSHSFLRPYMGDSTAVFAVAGALAATLPSARARWAILLGALTWETGVFWLFYHFGELNSFFHYAALASGFFLARSRLFARIPSPESAPAPAPRLEEAEGESA